MFADAYAGKPMVNKHSFSGNANGTLFVETLWQYLWKFYAERAILLLGIYSKGVHA